MEIYFPDAERRQLFCSESRLRARFGDELAEMICCRLQLLEEAHSVALVPPDPPIARRCEGGGIFSVSLGNSDRLLFEAVDEQLIPTGIKDLETIHSICVVAIENFSSSKGLRK